MMVCIIFYYVKGYVSRDEWKRSLAKIGIGGISEENILTLFNSYDANQNGKLEYKEFIGALYPVQGTEADQEEMNQDSQQGDAQSYYDSPQKTQQQPQQTTGSSRRGTQQQVDPKLQVIMEKVRSKLASRGARGIIGLGKAFRVLLFYL
jgi:hypothetical protein